jgi:tetratricopeptide (TPR) repeat protein
MKRIFTSAAFAALVFAAAPAHAVTMLYFVDPAVRCSQAAQNIGDLHAGLSYCDEALRDPLMNHRGGLLVDRGIVKFALDDAPGALADFNAGLAENPALGDGYINRAALLISLRRFDEARADIGKAMELGANNMHAAYYDRAVIEDEAGDYPAAYRDYKQALALKPGYSAAARELARFKPGNTRPQ